MEKNRRIIETLLKLLGQDMFKLQTLNDLFSMCRYIEEEDFDYAHEINKIVKNNSALGAKELGSIEHYELYKKSLLFDAPHDFDSYLIYLEFDREPEKRFYLPRRKQLRTVVQAMQDLVDDKLDLVTVSMPPGTGKSTLGIYFLSWVIGRDPLRPNLASAHGSKLTRSFYDGVYELMTDPEYLYVDVFPLNRIVHTSAKDEEIHVNRKQRFPSLTCRSIDGTLTGATRCENILYADDLVKGIEEALSIERMNKLWEKYTNDLKSRKKQGAKEIHVATRWSVHDPIGRLEQQYGNDPRARFIVLPALNENDESNFDYPYGVGFDTEYYHDMRMNLDDLSWRALYMNQPIESEGLLFHVDDLNRYYELPQEEPDFIVSAVDTAEGGGDSTCMPVGYGYGTGDNLRVYIEDVVFDNGLPEVTDPLLINKLLDHMVQMSQFESNSAGGRTADVVQKGVKERGGITHITKKRTTQNKLTRIIVNSSYIKKHFYFKDESQYRPNDPYGRYIKELTTFTQAGKVKHDDAPDATTQLAEFIQSMEGNVVEIMKRPF